MQTAAQPKKLAPLRSEADRSNDTEESRLQKRAGSSSSRYPAGASPEKMSRCQVISMTTAFNTRLLPLTEGSYNL
jgi:hypothetical protein